MPKQTEGYMDLSMVLPEMGKSINTLDPIKEDPDLLKPIKNEDLQSPRSCQNCSRTPVMAKGVLCCPICGPLWVIEKERTRLQNGSSRVDWPDPDFPETKKVVLETSSEKMETKKKGK